MRSVERVVMALCLGLVAGCSTVGEKVPAVKEATVAAPAPTPLRQAQGQASLPPGGREAPELHPPPPGEGRGGGQAATQPPIAPATQQAYDDALRLLRAGRTDDAERAFQAVAQANPELGGPHANLALIHRRAGRLPEAAAQGELAVKLSPQQAVYWNQLGITYRQQGRFTQAREAYEKAIELDPADAAPHLNLGILHDLYLGDGKRALELYDRYLALSPAGDATVNKWMADLRNRKPPAVAMNRKEKE